MEEMSLKSLGSIKVIALLLTIICTLSFLVSYSRLTTPTYISAEMISDGSTNDSPTLAQQITAALEMHKSGQLDEAIILYEAVIPSLTGKLASTLHSNVGSIYMNKGENDMARDHFTMAVDSEPDNASAHFNLAVLLTSKFEVHGKAIKHCGTALKLDPTMYKALHLMGNILQNLGKDDEAQKYFVMAENLALELSEPEEAASGTRTTDDESYEEYDAWARFSIMSARLGDKFSVKSQSSQIESASGSDFDSRDYQLICISERPLIFRVPEFISIVESAHIIERAGSQLKKSFVMGGKAASLDDTATDDIDGIKKMAAKETIDDQSYRSSYNAWLHSDKLTTQLHNRLADITQFPVQLFQQKSEELQVVKYEKGGQFKVHHDSSAFQPRLLTALLYLNDVPADMGGETWFPFAGKRREFNLSVEEAISTALQMHSSSSNTCAANCTTEELNEQGGLYVRPVKGDAIIFFNHLPSGALDPAAVHAGLPIGPYSENNGKDKEGNIEKWIANYWVEQDFKILFADSNS